METKPKNRAWVKNVAIIFLAVMLVLTFFSNTIMNRSLPEVATQNISSGTITAKIRGTGTVAANQTYDVVINQTREVKSVLIKAGQEVKTGDVLFVLADTASDELKSAQDNLRTLNVTYQKDLINAADTDYAKQNRDIQLAKQDLEDAQAKRDKLTVTDDDVDAARQVVSNAKNEVIVKQAAVDNAQAALDAVGSLVSTDNDSLSSLSNQISSKRSELAEARTELETAQVMYGGYYDAVKQAATDQIMATAEYQALKTDSAKKSYIEKKLPVYMPAVAASYKSATDDTLNYYTAYTTIKACSDNIEKINSELDLLYQQYDSAMSKDNSGEYSKASKKLKAAQAELKTATDAETNAEAALTDIKAKQTDYTAALDAVKTAQKALEDQIFALQEQQKTDNKNQQLSNVDIQDLANQIAEAEKKVSDLTADAGQKEITSNVNGIVQTVAITAGNSTTSGTPMATILVPDMGYSLSFSVSNEQAKKVQVGDQAEQSNSYYYGNQITATLTAIKPDPQNSQTSKQLVFDIKGDDVTVGTSLSLTLGQRSAQYDYIVPNSALRSDSNGDFILIVEAKNGPLGNKYIATRVEVEKLANDDTNTAVSGGLNMGDFVITTSTKPISNGDRVRMADTNNERSSGS